LLTSIVVSGIGEELVGSSTNMLIGPTSSIRSMNQALEIPPSRNSIPQPKVPAYFQCFPPRLMQIGFGSFDLQWNNIAY